MRTVILEVNDGIITSISTSVKDLGIYIVDHDAIDAGDIDTNHWLQNRFEPDLVIPNENKLIKCISEDTIDQHKKTVD